VGYSEPAPRPRSLAVRLPDGRVALSQALKAPLAAQLGQALAAAGPGRQVRTGDGERYRAVDVDAVVEVLAGTTRHGVVSVTRAR
jgi:hypothetical protein